MGVDSVKQPRNMRQKDEVKKCFNTISPFYDIIKRVQNHLTNVCDKGSVHCSLTELKTHAFLRSQVRGEATTADKRDVIESVNGQFFQ